MNICLKTYAKQDEPQQIVITLQERLPERIIRPCEFTCIFHVVSYGDYYLLTLDIVGALAVKCQRCLSVFEHEYCNQSKLAVCRTDTVAEALMEHFECVVAENDEIDLLDILADELHLFSPEKHNNYMDCNNEISQLIGGQDEIMPPTLGL